MTASKDKPRDQADDCADLARQWLADLFAPWVKALNLSIVSAQGGRTEMILPFDADLCRQGGTI